jgi:2'-5' RNA ligase
VSHADRSPAADTDKAEEYRPVKVQARITLPPSVRHPVDTLRAEWNPERATGNPAHVTVIYHDEAPDPTLLAARLRLAASRVAPFRVSVGSVQRFPEPDRGAYLTAADPDGGVAAVRELVLASPFSRRTRYGLHVTLLHPDQGFRLESAWAAFENLPPVGEFEVAELQMVGPDNSVLAAFQLAGSRSSVSFARASG